jgi:hypothetical protein
MAMRRGHHTSRVLEALDDSGPRMDFEVAMGRMATLEEDAAHDLHEDLLSDGANS